MSEQKAPRCTLWRSASLLLQAGEAGAECSEREISSCWGWLGMLPPRLGLTCLLQPLAGSWHICSTTESKGCSLCSSVHVKVCHLAPGNLPQQSSPLGGSGTPSCWPRRCLIGKRLSELSGGVGAVVEAAEWLLCFLQATLLDCFMLCAEHGRLGF